MRKLPDTLYLMRVGEWLKVGITHSTASRSRSMMYEVGQPVAVLRTWFVGPDVRMVEGIAVGRLKLHRARGREYFNADEPTVVDAINKALSMWERCETEPCMRASFDAYLRKNTKRRTREPNGRKAGRPPTSEALAKHRAVIEAEWLSRKHSTNRDAVAAMIARGAPQTLTENIVWRAMKQWTGSGSSGRAPGPRNR